jgi:hypothetical protein
MRLNSSMPDDATPDPGISSEIFLDGQDGNEQVGAVAKSSLMGRKLAAKLDV